MQYDDEKAKAIIAKFNLDEKTIKVWKTRGKIPDKYFSDDYQPPVKASKADLILQKRIIEVLERGFLQVNIVTELAGLKPQKYFDVRRGNVAAFSANEIRTLKSEISKLRLSIVKAFEKKSEHELVTLLKNDAILINPIMKDGGAERIDVERLSRLKHERISIDAIDYELTKNCFIKAAMQLSV